MYQRLDAIGFEKFFEIARKLGDFAMSEGNTQTQNLTVKIAGESFWINMESKLIQLGFDFVEAN